MELDEEYQKGLKPEVILQHVINYYENLNDSEKKVLVNAEAGQLIVAEIKELANQITHATPQELELIEKLLLENDSDDEVIKEAKQYINNNLLAFYKNLHDKFVDATQQYASNVAQRLEKYFESSDVTAAEGRQREVLFQHVGNNKDQIEEKIMSGTVPRIYPQEGLPSTPTAREALILSQVSAKLHTSEPMNNWKNYRDSLLNSINELPADKLEQITQERSVSTQFKNAVNSICKFIGLSEPFSISNKNAFKDRLLSIKAQAGVEEPEPERQFKPN